MQIREIKLSKVLFKILVLAGVSASALGARTAIGDTNGDLTFNFGESCEQLFDLVDEELRSLTSAAHADSFARICVPEWPNTCDDYSAVIAHFGDLKASPDDYFCHFLAR